MIIFQKIQKSFYHRQQAHIVMCKMEQAGLPSPSS